MVGGERVYWHGMYGQLCGGNIERGPARLPFESADAEMDYWLVRPDDSPLSIWLTGPFTRLPSFTKG